MSEKNTARVERAERELAEARAELREAEAECARITGRHGANVPLAACNARAGYHQPRAKRPRNGADAPLLECNRAQPGVRIVNRPVFG